jgi:hypothetical protein
VGARIGGAGTNNVVVVALANKLARIAWAVLARGRTYEAAVAVRIPVNVISHSG